MLILEGRICKSYVVETILNHTNSVGITYNHSLQPFMASSSVLSIDDNKESIPQLIANIRSFLTSNFGASYEFIVIYTNLPRTTLEPYMYEFEDIERKYCSKALMLTCKC